MLKLPKTTLEPDRVSAVEAYFSRDVRPVFEGVTERVSYLTLDEPLREALRVVARTGCLTRGLETIARDLDDEKKGLVLVQQKTGQPEPRRMSRLLLLSNDGAERFYRQAASLLGDHGNRVWGCRLDIDDKALAALMIGQGVAAKAVLINDKKALATFLTELARRV